MKSWYALNIVVVSAISLGFAMSVARADMTGREKCCSWHCIRAVIIYESLCDESKLHV